jgi:hypothetical protein
VQAGAFVLAWRDTAAKAFEVADAYEKRLLHQDPEVIKRCEQERNK